MVCMYYRHVFTNKKVTVSSVHVRNLLKQFFKHKFRRINELSIVSIFEDHILSIFMTKTGPGKQVRIIKVQITEVRL